MKKLLLLSCFAFLTSISYAQNRNPFIELFGCSDFKETKMNNQAAAEVYAGVNSSTLPVSNSESSSKSLLGFHAGIGTPVCNLSKALGLRAGLMYSQQGDKSSYGGNSYYSSSTETRLNYLYLPVTARYQNSGGFFAEAGLQPGLLLSAKRKSTSSGMGGGSSGTTNIKKDLNSFDLSLPIAAGYVFKKKIAISARVIPGLSNVNKKVDDTDVPKKRNLVFSARVSYLL